MIKMREEMFWFLISASLSIGVAVGMGISLGMT